MTLFQIAVNTEETYSCNTALLESAAEHALVVGGANAPSALSIIVTSSERVHELNRQYAGIDSPTDVLSFPVEESPYSVEPGEPPYLGDVIIAFPVARTQAVERGHSVDVELYILTIHGVLHLLGYDHDTPDRQAEMWALESAALDALRSAGK